MQKISFYKLSMSYEHQKLRSEKINKMKETVEKNVYHVLMICQNVANFTF